MVMACSRETPLLVPMLREIRGKFVAVTHALLSGCALKSVQNLHWRRGSPSDQTPTFYPPRMTTTFYSPSDGSVVVSPADSDFYYLRFVLC